MNMIETTKFRLTIDRPICGRKGKAGEVIELTAKEYSAEAGWGGLEPVAAVSGIADTEATAETASSRKRR